MALSPSVVRTTEDHFFFAPSNGDWFLYARVHVPAEPASVGVVIVPPVGRERVRVCAEMSVLGRDLADAGYPVLRFDYRGEGESSGAFSDSTLTTRVADTVAAAHEMQRRFGVERIALVGVHLGAVVAALAAREAGASLLLLCDPICDPRAYVTGLLRTVIFQQRQQRGRTGADTTLRAGLGDSQTVNIFGYEASGLFLNELETADPVAALVTFGGDSAILYFATRPGEPPAAVAEWARHLGAPARSTAAAVVMNFSWTTRKQWTPRLGALNTAVIDWLDRHDAVAGSASGARA